MTGAGIIIAAAGQCVRRKHVCRDYVTCLDAKRSEPSTCRVKRTDVDENVIDFRTVIRIPLR